MGLIEQDLKEKLTSNGIPARDVGTKAAQSVSSTPADGAEFDEEDEGAGDPGLSTPSPLIARQVRAILTSSEIKQHKHNAWVRDNLKIGRRSATRKLHGEVPFTEAELTKMMPLLGFEYAGLDGLRAAASPGTTIEANSSEDTGQFKILASIEFEGRIRECLVEIEQVANVVPAARAKVLVMNAAGTAQVVSMEDVPDGATAKRIKSIEIKNPYLYEGSGPTLCVYHDNRVSASLLAGTLQRFGFAAMFASTTSEFDDILFARKKTDVFLICWSKKQRWTPEELAAKAKKAWPNAMVMFNVDEVADSEDEKITSAAFLFNAHVVIQPQATANIVRTILSELKKKSRARRNAPL